MPEQRGAMWTTSLWRVTRHALRDWWADHCPRLSASLAFYTALSEVCYIRPDREARQPDDPDGTPSRYR
jgi:hypothetical protein